MRTHRRPWSDVRASVSLTGGPSYSRDAADDDPPHREPAIRLGFAPPVEREVDPMLWEGDNA